LQPPTLVSGSGDKEVYRPVQRVPVINIILASIFVCLLLLFLLFFSFYGSEEPSLELFPRPFECAYSGSLGFIDANGPSALALIVFYDFVCGALLPLLIGVFLFIISLSLSSPKHRFFLNSQPSEFV